VRVIWTARLVVGMAAALLLSTLAFAAYQSGGPPPAAASRAVARVGPTPPQAVRLSGRVTVSGGLTRTWTAARVSVLSGAYGSCVIQARTFQTLVFAHEEQVNSRQEELLVTANLPNGTAGSGRYDLAGTNLSISAVFSRTGESNQLWSVRPGQSRATLQVKPDGSGTLTAASLAAAYPRPAGDPTSRPLNVSFSFACG